MNRWKFSMTAGIGLIVVFGIAFGAIRASSAVWAALLTSSTFFLLFLAFPGALLIRWPGRGFWLGFGFLGWSCFLLGAIPWLHSTIGQFLIGPGSAEELFELWHPPESPLQARMGPVHPARGFLMVAAFGGGGDSSGLPPGASPEALGQILRVLEILVWASLGGFLTRVFAERRGAPGQDGPGRIETAAPTVAVPPSVDG